MSKYPIDKVAQVEVKIVPIAVTFNLVIKFVIEMTLFQHLLCVSLALFDDVKHTTSFYVLCRLFYL